MTQPCYSDFAGYDDTSPAKRQTQGPQAPMTSRDEFEQRKRALVREYGLGSNAIGLLQSATTLVPLACLSMAATWGLEHNAIVAGVAIVGVTLWLVRVFVMMHECGHGALFASRQLNRWFGFLFGVISGMPQYVWAQHHDFHHRHNGNWERYRGPLSTLSTDEFAALSLPQQQRYRRMRSIVLAPFGGFMYLIFNPRINWLKGNFALVAHVLRGGDRASFKSPHWKTWREYRHMTANNVVLLSLWAALSSAVGTGTFFALYLPTLSVAGGVGIMLFTVQHNFDQSYAAPSGTWDYDKGALHGTSFLVLPAWLNWMTSNIGYHHVHHLSAAIPNYRLAECHARNVDLFADVPRVTLRQVPAAVSCILWDQRAERIISFGEYEQLARVRRRNAN
jgi:acyl-lipid omega-6 desaturase (Delta-12 desaturase)